MNSDGSISVYRREKREKKKNKNKNKNVRPSLSLSLSSPYPYMRLNFYSFLFFYFKVGPTCPIFFHFLVRFSFGTNYFISVSISFIIIEYFFKYLPFFKIFLKSHFQVSLYTRYLEIRKIFRLYRNLTKFDRVARFRLMNLTAQSVSSSKI